MSTQSAHFPTQKSRDLVFPDRLFGVDQQAPQRDISLCQSEILRICKMFPHKSSSVKNPEHWNSF